MDKNIPVWFNFAPFDKNLLNFEEVSTSLLTVVDFLNPMTDWWLSFSCRKIRNSQSKERTKKKRKVPDKHVAKPLDIWEIQQTLKRGEFVEVKHYYWLYKTSLDTIYGQ